MTVPKNLSPGELEQLLEKTKRKLRAVLAEKDVDHDQLCNLVSELNILRYLSATGKEKEKAS